MYITASFPLVIELPLKRSFVIIEIMKKNKGDRACFSGRAADSAHHLHFLQLGRLSKWHVRGRWKTALKNSILWNLHGGKAIKTYNVIKLKLKGHESGSAQHSLSKASVRK